MTEVETPDKMTGTEATSSHEVINLESPKFVRNAVQEKCCLYDVSPHTNNSVIPSHDPELHPPRLEACPDTVPQFTKPSSLWERNATAAVVVFSSVATRVLGKGMQPLCERGA